MAELNPSASCWLLTRCFLIYQQTSANQNTVHSVNLISGFIWKFSQEWLFWMRYASGSPLRKKPQSPTVLDEKHCIAVQGIFAGTIIKAGGACVKVILFFILFIGQLSMQFYKCRWFSAVHTLAICEFTRVQPSKKIVNSQIASVCKALNQLMHFRTRLVCSEIIKKTSENLHDILLLDFQRFMYWKSGKLTRKILRQQTNRYFGILNSSVPSQNIKTRTPCRHLFENLLPSMPTEITFEISFNLARS